MNGMPDKVSAADDATMREHVGLVFEIVAEHGDDDLRLVAVAGHEQRPDRAIDQTRDQGLALGRPAFALEIAAGNLARGVEFFLIVDGERKEIDAGFGFVSPTAVASNTVSP